MFSDLVVNDRLTIPASELSESTSRSGGPGGQAVNTADTRVSLRWSLRDSQALSEHQRERLLERLGSRLTTAGELVIHASEHRSQLQNREEARARLVATLRSALVVMRPRRPTRPTRGSVERRLAEKREQSARRRSRSQGIREED
jgi:ribosome-associated protein